MTRAIVIPDIFDPALAERVHRYLDGPEVPWHYSFPAVNLRDSSDNADAIKQQQELFEQHFAANTALAYRFRRTVGHEAENDCTCPVCDGCRALKSPETLVRIAATVGQADSKPHTMFASYYGPGDFLSPHTDSGLGRVAFVWNLTKGWRPQLGGCLHILSDDWQQSAEVILPAFNSLTVFDVSGAGHPHFVSVVARKAPIKRLAISGWML